MPSNSETSNTQTSSTSSSTYGWAGTLERLAHVTQGQLGPTEQTIYFLGDGLQRALTDEFFDWLTPKTWNPANLWRTGYQMTRQGLLLARGLTAPEAPVLMLRELRNKVDVFTLVKNLDARLNLPVDTFVPLSDLVEKAYSLPAFEALWAVEGVGHYYADSFWKFNGEPHALFSETNAPVAAKSMLMLHAGMGLAFADRLVGNLTIASPANDVRTAIQRFLELCQDNSRPGYLGAAIESLGLVSRDFYPDLLPLVSQQFRQVAPEYTGFFWHGAGRALYFSRKYFLPGLCVWCDVDELSRNEPDRLSAMAGVSWAASLVNMRQPAISENQLRLYIDGSPLARAYSNGVVSTSIMRTDTTPDESLVSTFIDHQPKDAQVADSWRKRITDPVKTALQSYYPVLSEHHSLDQVFRYQDLGILANQLSGQVTN